MTDCDPPSVRESNKPARPISISLLLPPARYKSLRVSAFRPTINQNQATRQPGPGVYHNIVHQRNNLPYRRRRCKRYNLSRICSGQHLELEVHSLTRWFLPFPLSIVTSDVKKPGCLWYSSPPDQLPPPPPFFAILSHLISPYPPAFQRLVLKLIYSYEVLFF